MAEWCNLPPDLLRSIAACLESPIDVVRFRAVCSAWRAVVAARADTLYNPFSNLSHDGFSAIFGGFLLCKRSIFLLSQPEYRDPDSDSSPNPNDSGCWLIKTEQGRPGFFRLLNPISRSYAKPRSVSIPNLIDLWNIRVCELGQEYALQYVNHSLGGDHSNLYMEKVAYLPETGRDYVLLTVHISGKLAVYISADEKWTVIGDPESLYDDVIAFDGLFYAVESSGRAVMVEALGSANMVVTPVAGPVDGGDKKCLVKLGKDLLMVDIYLGNPIGDDGHVAAGEGVDLDGLDDGLDSYIFMVERPIQFKVFKLDQDEQSWIEMATLGDHILFLGDNCAFCVHSSELPGCKGNCICFNFGDNPHPSNMGKGNSYRCDDVGVFSLEDKKIETYATYSSYSKLFWPPPSWIASSSSEVKDPRTI